MTDERCGTGITAPNASQDATPGVHLAPNAGRYVLRDEIARGGMGVVFRATDTVLDREVAVKVLQQRFEAGSAVARRFIDEARITGQLQHPGIPAVHDLGTLPDGRPFLAMKLIKGQTLDERLRDRADPTADRGGLAAVFEQVCQAVGYAHAHGVIHRDLKPANVMVGSFAEVQVMDWGLAKVLANRPREQLTAAPEETTAETEIRSLRESDGSETQAGSILGTPAFMPPEQAAGAVHLIDERSDVFGLGAILAVILSGQPPFVGQTAEDVRVLSAQGKVEDCFARLNACGADPDIVALCQKCLAAEKSARPANGGAVAQAVASLRAAADERARQAELDRVKAEGDKVAAELRIKGEQQKVEEQRRRRRVQLALAGFVAVVLAGAGIATVLVIEQRTKDKVAAEQKQSDERVAAEKKLGDERFAAEQKRQADLQAAQRQTRAEDLVRSLKTADTADVPRIVSDLADLRALARPKLVELAAEPVTTRAGLHARLGLVLGEPPPEPAGLPQPGRPTGWTGELATYLPTCKPEELLTIRDALKPHAAAVAPWLWEVLLDAKADSGKRVRAASALAVFSPTDERWAEVVAAVTDAVVTANPVEFVVWSVALEPVRGVLVPKLLGRYLSARADIRGGKLDESALAAAVSGYNLTADLLAQYTRDRPADLAELSVIADPRHYRLFVEAIGKNKGDVVPVLKAELEKKPPEKLLVTELDTALETHGKRRGYAAAALLALGEGEAVWPVFVFPKDGDPTARSYLVQRLALIGSDPLTLMRRFDLEVDVSAKRALLVALGDFPLELVPDAEQEALAGRLLVLYREHPDPGLHGAIDWLIRQKWGKAKELAAVDAELASASRAKVLARGLADVGPLPVGLLLPAPVVAEKRYWFVNGEGQTFVVVRGPVEFTMGSPPGEPGRIEGNEQPHRKRIPRTFAIATKEVTVAEFVRFLPKPDHKQFLRNNGGPDTPAGAMKWYEAAEYCNWLSAREGIPEDQWCYAPNKAGKYDQGMLMKPGHLELTGYRLPTEAEWEFACRGGTVTARYHGRGEELLPRYAWYQNNADNRVWPVDVLRPNELGLFDMLGNTHDWVEDPALLYVLEQKDDTENSRLLLIDERMSRLFRGGSVLNFPGILRCAWRQGNRPSFSSGDIGFRPVRTLP
jgi:formylglycine-generating enzyme required for sulfatase activity